MSTTRTTRLRVWLVGPRWKCFGCPGNQSTIFDWVVRISASPRSQSRYFVFLAFCFMPIETSKSGKMGKRTMYTMKIRSDSENCRCRYRCCQKWKRLGWNVSYTFVMWKCIIISLCVCKMWRVIIHPASWFCVQSNLTIVIMYAAKTNGICKEQFIPKPKRTHKARGRNKKQQQQQHHQQLMCKAIADRGQTTNEYSQRWATRRRMKRWKIRSQIKW